MSTVHRASAMQLVDHGGLRSMRTQSSTLIDSSRIGFAHCFFFLQASSSRPRLDEVSVREWSDDVNWWSCERVSLYRTEAPAVGTTTVRPLHEVLLRTFGYCWGRWSYNSDYCRSNGAWELRSWVVSLLQMSPIGLLSQKCFSWWLSKFCGSTIVRVWYICALIPWRNPKN